MANNMLVAPGSVNTNGLVTAAVLPKTQNIQIQTVLPTQQVQSLQQQQDNHILQQYYLNEINKELEEEVQQGCYCCQSDDEYSDDETKKIKYKEQKKKLVRSVYKNSFLFIVLIIYTFFGSLLFLLIENNLILNNNHKQKEINNTVLDKLFDVNIRNKTVEKIWDITVNLNILHPDNWTSLAEKEIHKFQYDIVKQLSKEIKFYRTNSHSPNNKDDPVGAILEFNEIPIEWNLAKTFFYSLSIVTTIGKCPYSLLLIFFSNGF
ncbi:hypothetical protein WDU94_010440 [Cyamophila willieti]